MATERFLPLLNTVLLVAGGSVWAVLDGYRLFEQRPYEYHGELTVTELRRFDDGTRLYDVDFDVEVKNLSRSEFTISYSFAELYLGDVTMRLEDLKAGQAVVVNETPDPWHAGPAGLVKWTKQAYEAAVADGPTADKVSEWMRGHFSTIDHGLGLTTSLSPGTSNEYEPEFLLRAKPTQHVAIVVGFGINNSIEIRSRDVGALYETLPLEDADQAARRRHQASKKSSH